MELSTSNTTTGLARKLNLISPSTRSAQWRPMCSAQPPNRTNASDKGVAPSTLASLVAGITAAGLVVSTPVFAASITPVSVIERDATVLSYVDPRDVNYSDPLFKSRKNMDAGKVLDKSRSKISDLTSRSQGVIKDLTDPQSSPASKIKEGLDSVKGNLENLGDVADSSRAATEGAKDAAKGFFGFSEAKTKEAAEGLRDTLRDNQLKSTMDALSIPPVPKETLPSDEDIVKPSISQRVTDIAYLGDVADLQRSEAIKNEGNTLGGLSNDDRGAESQVEGVVDKTGEGGQMRNIVSNVTEVRKDTPEEASSKLLYRADDTKVQAKENAPGFGERLKRVLNFGAENAKDAARGAKEVINSRPSELREAVKKVTDDIEEPEGQAAGFFGFPGTNTKEAAEALRDEQREKQLQKTRDPLSIPPVPKETLPTDDVLSYPEPKYLPGDPVSSLSDTYTFLVPSAYSSRGTGAETGLLVSFLPDNIGGQVGSYEGPGQLFDQSPFQKKFLKNPEDAVRALDAAKADRASTLSNNTAQGAVDTSRADLDHGQPAGWDVNAVWANRRGTQTSM